jgi:hypothetical protein
MVEEDRPVRDPAKQVKAEVTSLFGKNCVDFHGRRFEVMLFTLDRVLFSVDPPGLSWRSNEIVTAQHNDYTGRQRVHSGRESTA